MEAGRLIRSITIVLSYVYQSSKYCRKNYHTFPFPEGLLPRRRKTKNKNKEKKKKKKIIRNHNTINF
jgi:hypothetical protein